MRPFALLALLLPLAACADVYEKKARTPLGAGDAVGVPGAPMYCYKNLGAVTCFDRPVERDAARLIWSSRPVARPDDPSPPGTPSR